MIRRSNLYLILTISLIVIVEVLFLRPSSIEHSESAPKGLFDSIETQITSEKEASSLRQKDEVAYTISGFHYTEVQGETKQWELDAKTALLFEKTKIVVASDARIKMFDPKERVTYITGNIARYQMGTRDIEIEGNVKVLFPDGFWIKTSKGKYSGPTQTINTEEFFYGEGQPSQGENIQVWGRGFTAPRNSESIMIDHESHVRMRRLASDEVTDVRSDRAEINRVKKVVYFFMLNPSDRVDAHQGTWRVRGRNQEATYDPADHVVKYLIAKEDVLIEELDPEKSRKGMKYATCQRAEFFSAEDRVLLSGFPSVYQEQDTVTGDLITIFRKRNIVEVTQANAYHSEPPSSPAGSTEN